jgi:poly(A) polymerase/tRNA nucleotidyltransferase (CCA-adding enzyme)
MSSYREKLIILAQISDDLGDPSLADRFQRLGNDSYSPPGDALDERVKIMKERVRRANLVPSKLNTILPGLYAVGGCVRDTLMGRTPKDIDLCTSMPPDDVIATCRAAGYKVYLTGYDHGTVTVPVDGVSYEVTTYRMDVETDGRHAVVEFTPHIEADLARRDFTINAMAIDIEGNLIDLFGGIRDIENRVIRCVGDPNTRFREDFLRVIRAARFSSVLGFSIDPATLDAMYDESYEMNERLAKSFEKNPEGKKLAVERVIEEFEKAFEKSSHPSTFLNLMWQLGVVQTMIPEMEDADVLMQNPEWHPEGSVWQHTLDTVDRIDPKYRWHALFHDIGKCLTAQPVEGTEHNSFHGHDVAGAGIIHEIAERLRLPGDLRDSVETSVRMHMYPLQTRMEGKEPSARVIRRFQREIPSDDHLEALRHLVPADSGDRYNEAINPLFERRVDVTPVLRGQHLVDAGIQPGPDMGRRLRAAFEHQLETGITDVQELLRVALSA